MLGGLTRSNRSPGLGNRARVVIGRMISRADGARGSDGCRGILDRGGRRRPRRQRAVRGPASAGVVEWTTTRADPIPSRASRHRDAIGGREGAYCTQPGVRVRREVHIPDSLDSGRAARHIRREPGAKQPDPARGNTPDSSTQGARLRCACIDVVPHPSQDAPDPHIDPPPMDSSRSRSMRSATGGCCRSLKIPVAGTSSICSWSRR